MSKIVIGADVDNTLSFPNHDITGENVELCRGLEELGIPVILSTGKALEYAWRNADRFGGQAVFVENHGVWCRRGKKHEVYGPNLCDLIKLRECLNLSKTDEGVCEITLNKVQGQVAIEEGKFGVLTLFTEYEPVKHRWTFKQRWDREEVYKILLKIIDDKKLKLHVLEPHADGAIDVVRRDTDGKPINKRSFPELCKKVFPGVEKMVFLGDGTNDLPAMEQPNVRGVTFPNASKKLIEKMRSTQKGDIVTEFSAPEGGPAEGIWRLACEGFFEEKSQKVKKLVKPLLLTAVAQNAARCAGKVLLEPFGSNIELTGLAGEGSRSDISTIYDKKSDKILRRTLSKGFFNYKRCENEIGLISEESGVAIAERVNTCRGDKEPSKSVCFEIHPAKAIPDDWEKYSWIIDPLCGSIPYARGVADFIVSISLMQGREPKIGVVYDPVRNEMFSALKGIGAWLNGKPIQPSTTTHRDFEEKKTYVSIEHKVLRSVSGKQTQQFSQKIGRIRVAGTCGLELCYVACGRLDALIKLEQPSYDYAAGALILSEALRQVGKEEKDGLTDLKGKELEEPTLDMEKNRDILASNGEIHLIKITKEWKRTE
jgi:fructose-1,6-bisphosphatase/inositol monophosphatase family enzyme/hydroxymethylpyrimidine pyrophosphatase-like HAD family hydrolase